MAATRAERMPSGQPLPTYDDLLRAEPSGSSWDYFGRDDQLGTVNFLTPEVRKRAAGLIRAGRTINLDYTLSEFDPFPSGTRPPNQHHLFSNNPYHFDDWLDSFYLQGTTQIDALRHIGYPGAGWYGGRSREDIDTNNPTLGIQKWAEVGIVGRGVLLDVERYFASIGRPIDQSVVTEITVDDLEATATAQGVSFEAGDILILRTGWADYCRQHMDEDSRKAFKNGMKVPGLESSRAIVAWIWNHHFSMVAADNLGIEAFPYTPNNDVTQPNQAPPEKSVDHNGGLHRPLLPLLGLAIGEMFAVEELARDCAEDGVYEFFFSAKPLNLMGGVGSPANAMAIK
ncbi:cyclase family protein [Parafrigoribacterium humi]|uniref:cyclase family protein n=1 Tax=Parafrigoribacterium humi TaxID=3144664 RepID=UPI0032EE62B1